MPFTVITLKKVPPSLRGDLSKWMQEIAAGVYIGNYNVRVREKLWKRVCENVEEGEATISYASRNEIGYGFDTLHTKRRLLDMDGIPVVILEQEEKEGAAGEKKFGFSNAAKNHMARKYAQHVKRSSKGRDFVMIDLETSGLDADKDLIVEIGAVKSQDGELTEFTGLILTQRPLPDAITRLTGITDELLAKEGKDRKTIFEEFSSFIGTLDLVGYNIDFDRRFLEREFVSAGMEKPENRYYDLLRFVKNEKLFLSNYKLQTVLKEYGIVEDVPHRALPDARLIMRLSDKVKKFGDFMERK